MRERLRAYGLLSEIISWKLRFFVPISADGAAIIGKLIGIESLALFGKAQSVLNIFNQAITSAISPVVFPLFAARAREGGGQGEKGGAELVYLRTISYMTALAWVVSLAIYQGGRALGLG